MNSSSLPTPRQPSVMQWFATHFGELTDFFDWRPSTSKGLLALLGHSSIRSPDPWPSAGRLTTETGLGLRTVRRGLSELSKAGLAVLAPGHACKRLLGGLRSMYAAWCSERPANLLTWLASRALSSGAHLGREGAQMGPAIRVPSESPKGPLEDTEKTNTTVEGLWKAGLEQARTLVDFARTLADRPRAPSIELPGGVLTMPAGRTPAGGVAMPSDF